MNFDLVKFILFLIEMLVSIIVEKYVKERNGTVSLKIIIIIIIIIIM